MSTDVDLYLPTVTVVDATDTIIRNYRTTEARNNANASDIASVLGGVAAALNGDRNV